jgi:hypothetical protein
VIGGNTSWLKNNFDMPEQLRERSAGNVSREPSPRLVPPDVHHELRELIGFDR